MELKITADKVRAAAAKCSQAKQTLETLFPEAFEDAPHEDDIQIIADFFNNKIPHEWYEAMPGHMSKCKAIEFYNNYIKPNIRPC